MAFGRLALTVMRCVGQAFEFVANFARYLVLWDLTVSHVVPSAPPPFNMLPVQAGTQFEVYKKDGSDRLQYTVTACDRPRSIVLTGGNGTGRHTRFSPLVIVVRVSCSIRAGQTR